MEIWTLEDWNERIAKYTTRIKIDNRVFILGLDELYRNAMKRFESKYLLPRARVIANILQVEPADVPIEGYYHETPELREYFRLIRSLQDVDENRETEVKDTREFQQFWDVFNSPLFGRPQRKKKLFPVGRDPLSQALLDADWNVERLVRAAYHAALEYDDISLVGLAARIQDAVTLTAVRESAVLYAEVMSLGLPVDYEYLNYEWIVDDELATAANRFINIFNNFVPGALPLADSANAARFYKGYSKNDVMGRCVRIGKTPDETHHYHWAIVVEQISPEGIALGVDEFWSTHIWTTEKYREVQGTPAKMRFFSKTGVPEENWEGL